jgi:hypothetical protein
LQYQSPRAENRIEPELAILAIPNNRTTNGARYAAQVAMKPRSVLRIAVRKVIVIPSSGTIWYPVIQAQVMAFVHKPELHPERFSRYRT